MVKRIDIGILGCRRRRIGTLYTRSIAIVRDALLSVRKGYYGGAGTIGIVVITKNNTTVAAAPVVGPLGFAESHIGPERRVIQRIAYAIQQAIRPRGDTLIKVVRRHGHRIVAGGRQFQGKFSVSGGGEEVQRIFGLRRGKHVRINVTADKTRVLVTIVVEAHEPKGHFRELSVLVAFYLEIELNFLARFGRYGHGN